MKAQLVAYLLILMSFSAHAESTAIHSCKVTLIEGQPALAARLEIYNELTGTDSAFPPRGFVETPGLFQVYGFPALNGSVVVQRGKGLKHMYVKGSRYSVTFFHGNLGFGSIFGLENYPEASVSCE